jgi:hypothetical protein
MHATVVNMHHSELKRIILDGLVADQHYLQVKKDYNKEMCLRK